MSSQSTSQDKERDAASVPKAIEINNLSFVYPLSSHSVQPTEALKGITLSLDHGQRLGILGPNGGGKSTLIKLILGQLNPTAGSIKVLGESPQKARRRGLIGYLPQHNTADRDWPLNSKQVIELGMLAQLKPWQKLSTQQHDEIQSSMELVGVHDLADRSIGSLSGGQFQRVMIARAIAPRPKLLILDEPTVGVDVAGQHMFAEMIQRLHSQLGLTVITVTHDLRTVAASSDRVACLSQTLHFHDDPSGLTPQVLAQVFAHDVEAVFGAVHIDAHSAADCDDPSHDSTHAPSHEHDHTGCSHDQSSGGNP
ncbi:MAG: metal ABC transporter ATP-binding protein [Phycisphaerales bacterium]